MLVDIQARRDEIDDQEWFSKVAKERKKVEGLAATLLQALVRGHFAAGGLGGRWIHRSPGWMEVGPPGDGRRYKLPAVRVKIALSEQHLRDISRGWILRVRVERQLWKMGKNCNTVQRIWRGFSSRRHLLYMHQCASKYQALWKGWRTRRWKPVETMAALYIQRLVRAHYWRFTYARYWSPSARLSFCCTPLPPSVVVSIGMERDVSTMTELSPTARYWSARLIQRNYRRHRTHMMWDMARPYKQKMEKLTRIQAGARSWSKRPTIVPMIPHRYVRFLSSAADSWEHLTGTGGGSGRLPTASRGGRSGNSSTASGWSGMSAPVGGAANLQSGNGWTRDLLSAILCCTPCYYQRLAKSAREEVHQHFHQK